MGDATTLLVEPVGGLAGDMLLAALVDLGDARFGIADLAALADALVPGEARVRAEEVHRRGFRATRVVVETPESGRSPHRRLGDCLDLLARAPLGAAARARAERVLRRLAAAEGRAHGIAPDEVHFHEVGAVDALVDVAGAALALERLGVARVLATPPLVGSGTVRCAHGEVPVPAPGTAELLRGVSVRLGGEGERLTPTGAALLVELAETFAPAGAFAAEAVGYGAGARDPADGPPNLVRVQLGRAPAAEGERPVVWELACNLDDATGEEVGFCLAALRAAGALEAWSEAVQMKKDRPGVVVRALAREEGRAALEAVLFAHTPTLGLRWLRAERTECAREVRTVEVVGHTVRVTLRRRPGAERLGPLDLQPEYEDLAAAARATGRPLRELDEAARRAAAR